MIQTGSTLGNAICKAMGLDAHNVISLTVSCRADELAHMTVEMCVLTNQEVEHAFINYKLEPASFSDWLNLRILEEKAAIHKHYRKLMDSRYTTLKLEGLT